MKVWRRRVVKSVMAVEGLIQAKAAEACKPNDDKRIKLECFTDNHQLYDSLYSIRPIQDKRLWTIFRKIAKYCQKIVNNNAKYKLIFF